MCTSTPFVMFTAPPPPLITRPLTTDTGPSYRTPSMNVDPPPNEVNETFPNPPTPCGTSGTTTTRCSAFCLMVVSRTALPAGLSGPSCVRTRTAATSAERSTVTYTTPVGQVTSARTGPLYPAVEVNERSGLLSRWAS